MVSYQVDQRLSSYYCGTGQGLWSRHSVHWLSKVLIAFPTKKLLNIISKYGIKGKTLNWITAFLTDSRQRVVVNESYLEWAPVVPQVPQGSVLGLILFCYKSTRWRMALHQLCFYTQMTPKYSDHCWLDSRVKTTIWTEWNFQMGWKQFIEVQSDKMSDTHPNGKDETIWNTELYLNWRKTTKQS